jgi:norsolorinic acid ketoreductase
VRLPLFKGIGNGLVAALLLRPNTTVIATVRHVSTSNDLLTSLLTGERSKLIIAHLDISTTSITDIETATKKLAETLKTEHGIQYINVLVANAGLSAFASTINTPLSSLVEHFHANTIGPIALYQALHPLLDAADGDSKCVVISSSLGSIGAMEGEAPTLAYGISKAGVNYAVRKVHYEDERVVAFAMHPG